MSGIDLAVLDQSETWTDVNGHVHRIADMEARYCRNVIAFLQRRADEIADAVGLSFTTVALPNEATAAYLAVTAGIDEEFERMGADPVAWLNTKPLIKALQRRAAKGD